MRLGKENMHGQNPYWSRWQTTSRKCGLGREMPAPSTGWVSCMKTDMAFRRTMWPLSHGTSWQLSRNLPIWAQHNLGNMYYDGRGVPKDYMAALQWFRLAAKQGEASAQHKLGVMHEEGQDVAQSYEAAVEQYQLAAKQGFAKAQMSLGDMYKGGHGIPQNYIRAYVCYSLVAAAAAQGDDSASKLRDEVVPAGRKDGFLAS